MKSKYDKDVKILTIEQGLTKEITKLKKDCYKNRELLVDEFGEIYYVNHYKSEIALLIGDNKDKNYDCARLLLESKEQKAKKVKKKIAEICESNNAVFLTLTFTDEVLSKTSENTRRRYVSRYLKSVCSCYVANIDFSPDINREHYHAVVDKRVDLKKWKYGFAYAEKVRANCSSPARLSKYITKLTAHALKVDSGRLIYSRAVANM